MSKSNLYMLRGHKAIKGLSGWITYHYKKHGDYKHVGITTDNLRLVRRADGSIPDYISNEVRQLLSKR